MASQNLKEVEKFQILVASDDKEKLREYVRQSIPKESKSNADKLMKKYVKKLKLDFKYT